MDKLLIVLNNILRKKQNEEKLTNIKINRGLIDELKEYDIVYVKMNESDIKQFHVKEGHKTRPFLIIKKKEGKQIVNGYYLTSKIMENSYFEKPTKKGLKIILTKKDYQFQYKNGIILYQNNIKLPYENILNYIDELKKDDINKLKKYKAILSHKIIISTKENQTIEIADIINYENQEYIIYQIDNTYCYGYPIIKSNENINIEENYNYIVFNNQLYFIDYKNSKKINKTETLYIVNRFNEEIIEIIKHNKKLIKVAKKENRPKSKIKKRR